jgi:hypothetical protein
MVHPRRGKEVEIDDNCKDVYTAVFAGADASFLKAKS